MRMVNRLNLRPTRRGATGALLAIVVALSASACASAFQQPEVAFEGVRLGTIGIRGGLLYAHIQVTNPNRLGFQTQSLSYDLELRAPAADGQGEWVRLAEGVFTEDIRVPGRGSTMVEIPIEFTYAGLDGALRSVLDRGSVSYRVAGVVEVRDPVRRSVPYRRTGVVAVGGGAPR
jgi:LEA14-like dessication related protein